MRSVLLVNLMRMGDLLQMTPVIEALREQTPGARIGIVLNEDFVEVARRIDADTIHPLPVGSLRQWLGQDGDMGRAYRCLKEFSASVNDHGPYDLVFNLTPSRSAASLSSLIACKDLRGMGLGPDGSFLAVDPWAAYLVAMMASRRTNPFHLVDIWLRTVGQHGPRALRMNLSRTDMARAEELLAGSGICLDRDFLVGFQVSASQREKCWSPREFVRLGQAIHRGLKGRVVLFGLEGERPLCEEVSARIPGSVNLAGRTDLGQLAGVLKHCRILVTNDTGTQHVATAVGTPVLVVSVGPVFFRETGPYGEGHFVVQARVPCAPCSFHTSCLNPVCKGKIRADRVYKVLVRALRKGAIPGPSDGVSCYRSGFDAEGCLVFTPDMPGAEDRRLGAYKAFWHGILDGRDPCPGTGPWDADLGPDAGTGWTRLGALLDRASGLIRAIGETDRENPASPLRLRVLGANLLRIEEELRRLAAEVEELAPIIHYLIMRRESLSPRDPARFLRETSSLYGIVAYHTFRVLRAPEKRKEAICHA